LHEHLLEQLMQYLLTADQFVFHAINSLAGHPVLDYLAAVEERMFLFSGVIILAPYIWLWFEAAGPTQIFVRRRIITLIGSCLGAIVVARALAHALPFRERPMYAGIGYHPPAIKVFWDFEKWSSFPSDHAAMYFALATGVFILSRKFGTVLLVYVTVFICLARVYLGIHYPSDTLVGAAIGIGAAIAAVYISDHGMVSDRIVDPIVRFSEKHPGLFYVVCFALICEMAAMFADVRFMLADIRQALS
jgi:membrane-associated phospholipid phosphatase